MAGTDHTKPLISAGPAVVLVHPQLGENIGMVARAMANFGLDDLRLVSPRDGWPSDKAMSASAGAVHVVESAKVFESLAEAIGDLTYTVATTARMRDGFKRVLGPEESVSNIRALQTENQNCGMIFGREKSGLTNEEVSLADEIVTFPVNPAYASLNLAQAVLLMSYEYFKAGTGDTGGLPFSGPQFDIAPKGELTGLFGQLEEALEARGYFRPIERMAAQKESIRSVLSRPGFSIAEIRVLRGIVSSLDRFTRDRPRGEGAPKHEPRRAGKPDND
ncbi:MAG: RNA methyltransferase [Pseudomonadota bacterium]